MQIPFIYCNALFWSLIILLCYGNNMLQILRSKVWRMSAAILISLATSCSWGLVVCDSLPHNYQWLIYIFAIVFGFINLTFIWDESLSVIKPTNNNAGVTYTMETLIGQRGVVITVLGNKKYVGTLFDEANTEILVEIEEYNAKNNTFVIDRIENGTIYAKMSD